MFMPLPRVLCVLVALGVALVLSSPVLALDPAAPAAQVVVTPLGSATETAAGQPITLPQKDVQVLVSSYEIPAGATLPVHKHPFPRYAYVLAGNLQVTNVATGKTTSYKTGDFIVEMIGEWHRAANLGADPVRLLVIDQVEQGAKNTILQQ